MSPRPEVYAYEIEDPESGELHGERRLIADESLTVLGKSPDGNMVKLRTAEGWIAWASIDALVKITLN